MLRPLILITAACLPYAALADSIRIDTGKLPSKEVYQVATLTPLALSPDKQPAVVLLSLDDGEVVPPHAAESGMRLLTVVSGSVSWGDGEAVDPGKEKLYSAGSILAIPPGDSHWLAARNGDVVLQLVVLDDEVLVPGIQEQLK